MSGLTINITIDGDTTLPRRAVESLRTMIGAALACAEGAVVVFENHFVNLASSNRNKFGARGGFWNRMLSGTKAGGDGHIGFIRMPREVGARRYGATITPKKGKFLAIPARSEAYGKSPRQFDDLHFIPTRGGGILVKTAEAKPRGERKRARRIGGGKESRGQAFYFLVPKVVINPNPAIFPHDSAITGAASKAAIGWFQLQIRRGERG
jgi:hypothetical protein